MRKMKKAVIKHLKKVKTVVKYFVRGNKWFVVLYTLLIILTAVIPLAGTVTFLGVVTGIQEYQPQERIGYDESGYYTKQEYIDRTFSTAIVMYILFLLVVALFYYVAMDDFNHHEKRECFWSLIRPAIDFNKLSKEGRAEFNSWDKCIGLHKKKKR